MFLLEIKTEEKQKFETTVTSKQKLFNLNLKETWKYKDLIWLFVQRDFKTKYKQTVLGSRWFIIQPLFYTIVYTLVFGAIDGAKELR